MEHLLNVGGIAAWSGDVAWGLLDAGLKGFVLLALVGAAMTLMRRRSAAARHMVWMLAMAGLLALPLVSVWMPKWHLALLPARTPALPVGAPSVLPPSPSVPAPRAAAGEQPSVPSSAMNSSPSSFVDPTALPTALSDPSLRAEPSQTSTPFPWALLVLSVWFGGAVLSAAPLVFGMWAVHRLARRACAVEDASWLRLGGQLQTHLRIRRPVRLLRTDAATMPMTWGFRRPIVLLPESADAWNEDKRRVVLLHEFAHVKRRDCLTHANARLAFAVHWFNPLAWVAMRRLRIERERACDDLVLNAGSAPADYANHLLHIALSMRNPSLASAAAITMARPGQLEKRLRAILDSKRNRGSVTSWALLGSVIVVFAAILIVALLDVTSEARGFSEDALFARARDIRKTTLEARFIGAWRNLPFDISTDEEADAKQCIELAKRIYKSRNDENEFASESTREALEAILAKRPDYFYAEYLLGTWHQLAGNEALSRLHHENAYRHARVVIIQRYVGKEGRPLVGFDFQTFALECNRVKKGYLDPSLELLYPALTTDQHGAVYLPVYDTVYRRDSMSVPDGYTVNYPKLGWFESRGKIGMLPTATVTPETADAGQANAQAEDTGSHTIWQGYAAANDASLLLTGISIRPNEREWYSIGNLGNRGWLLTLWADNNTEETQYVVAQIDARTDGWLSGQTQRVVLFEFPAKFSGAVERPFKVESSWRENTVSLLVAKSAAVKPGERLTALEPGTYEELHKTMFVIPFPDAAALPAKPILKAHRYWRQQDQIRLEFEHADTEWQHPSGEEIPVVYARIIGEVRKTNVSSSPFGSGKTGFTLDLGRDEENGGRERKLIPGKHTLSLVFPNVPAVRKDNPEVRTTFPEITSNEIEIEIVDEIPEGYYQLVYGEGWAEILNEKLQKPTYNVWDEGKTLTVTLNVGEDLPCGIAFKASIQAEGDSKTYEVGSIAAPAHAKGGYGNSSECPHDLDVKTLSSMRWRVTYTPSQEIASRHPDIRQFYGREIVTDWMKFVPQQDWIRKALREAGANNISEQLDAVTRDREWPVDLDGTVKTISGTAGPGWNYGKGTDIAQRATQEGGGLRIQPKGETRLFALDGVESHLDALKFVRQHLDALLASTTTEVNARPDETIYAAVLSDERSVYILQIDTDAELRERWMWFEDPIATAQLAGRNQSTRHELVVYLGTYGSTSKSGPGVELTEEGSFSVGDEVAMSIITWETLDTTDMGKRYRFTLRQPVDKDGNALPNTKTSTKEVTYTGGTVALFEEEGIWIGIEETTWNTAEPSAGGQITPLVESDSGVAAETEAREQARIRELIAAFARIEPGFVNHMTLQTHDTDETRELVKIGAPAVPLLIEALTNPNKHIRRHAAYTLGLIGDTRAIKPLLACCRAEQQRNAEANEWDNDVMEPAAFAVVKVLFPEHAGEFNWVANGAGMIYPLTAGGYEYEWTRQEEMQPFWKEYRSKHPTVFTWLEDLDEELRAAIHPAVWEQLKGDTRSMFERLLNREPDQLNYIRFHMVQSVLGGRVPEFDPNRKLAPGIWWPVGQAVLPAETYSAFLSKREDVYNSVAARGPSVVPELVSGCIEERTWELRDFYAREIVNRMGASAVPALSEALKVPAARARSIAFHFLASMNVPEAKAAIQDALKSDYEDVRRLAEGAGNAGVPAGR